VEPGRRLAHALELLDALEYLHRRGVVHGDLKPSNVLVSDGHARLVDFGLSLYGDAARTGARWGTPAYMAPELLAGAPPTSASDLFAAGVILFELLCGAHPFQGGTYRDPDLRGVDPAFRPLLARLLHPSWRAGPESAAEVLRLLREAAPLEAPCATHTNAEYMLLRRAPFVGRGGELSVLVEALDAVVEAKRGSALLVHGPSGVGKSRLLEDLVIVLVGLRPLESQAI
jgi:serine/threonine protein kinase